MNDTVRAARRSPSPRRCTLLAFVAALLVCVPAVQAQILVYDDSLHNGWTDDSFGNPPGVVNGTDNTYAHTGTFSYSIVGNSFNAIGLTNAAAVTTASYPIIHFWVNGGAASGQSIYIFVGANSAPLDNYIVGGGGIAAGQWKEVSIDVSQPPFGAATYNQIYLQAQVDGQTTYFDDISLQPPAGPPPANAMQYDHDISTLPVVSPMLSDRITWQDSSGHPRSAVLAHDNAGVNNPANNLQVYGEALRQFTYQLSDGSTRTADVTTYGNGGYGGFGYVVDHSNDYPNCVGDDSPLGDYSQYGSFTRIFEGRHHSIYRYTQNYPRNCSSEMPPVARTVPVTIDWVFSTGRDNPLYAITYDIDLMSPNPQPNVLDDDSRAPYGELNIDGDGGAQVDGTAWGDRYKFTSTGATPETLGSSWDYTVANTVPYVKEWYAGALTVDHKLDATMGLVQSQTIDQQDAGGSRNPFFHDITVLWQHTSADNLANPNGYHADCPYTMPCANEWAYQANADNLGPATSNNNTRMTWRTQWGFIGQQTYDKHDPNQNLTGVGYPKQSYEVYVVLGQHSLSPVEAQVTEIETIQHLTLTINGGIGGIVTSGPAGIARADSVNFSPAGYNHVRGALEFSASGNALDGNIAVGAGTLKHPVIIIDNYTSANDPTLTFNGTQLTADSDYFASLWSVNSQLWITLNRNLTGATNRLQITSAPPGTPGAPTIGQATPGNGQATIAFTPPASDGGSPITSYTATCNPGAITGSNAASPITVFGLTSGVQYSCTVTATNANGTGPASAPVAVTLLNNRSFVSTSGTDANNCTPSAACRSFGRAVAMTYPGGEVIAVSSGGYGSFSAGNAITVIGSPGINASLTVSNGNGVDIAAGASDRVVLRGLHITMLNAASGMNAMTFGTLSIEKCSVTGGSFGILITGGAGSFATVSDAVVQGPSIYGAAIKSHAALLDCRIEGSGDSGLFLQDGAGTDAVVSAVGLVSIANANHGVWVKSVNGGHSVALDLDHAMLSGNLGDGVFADGSGAGAVSVRATHSTSTSNAASGFAQSGAAAFQSLGNNLVAGNGVSDTSGAITAIAGH